jgi:hypothetical protein
VGAKVSFPAKKSAAMKKMPHTSKQRPGGQKSISSFAK